MAQPVSIGDEHVTAIDNEPAARVQPPQRQQGRLQAVAAACTAAYENGQGCKAAL